MNKTEKGKEWGIIGCIGITYEELDERGRESDRLGEENRR